MTAVGFLLIVFSWIGLRFFTPPHRITALDYLFVAVFLVGGGMVVTGIAQWLWAVMP